MRFVIDTADFWHRIRRWIWRMPPYGIKTQMLMTGWCCHDCGATLTREERHCYGVRCERCEDLWMDQLEGEN